MTMPNRICRSHPCTLCFRANTLFRTQKDKLEQIQKNIPLIMFEIRMMHLQTFIRKFSYDSLRNHTHTRHKRPTMLLTDLPTVDLQRLQRHPQVSLTLRMDREVDLAARKYGARKAP